MNGLRETSPILALKQGEKPLQPVFIGVKHLCIQKNSTFAPHFRILSRDALKSIGVADGSALYRGENCQIHSESPVLETDGLAYARTRPGRDRWHLANKGEQIHFPSKTKALHWL